MAYSKEIKIQDNSDLTVWYHDHNNTKEITLHIGRGAWGTHLSLTSTEHQAFVKAMEEAWDSLLKENEDD